MPKRFPKKKSPPAQASVAQKQALPWEFWLPRVALITGLTLWIYWPALTGNFILDDNWYLATNPLMQAWGGLWKFWAQPGSWVEYYPIEETVQWVQWQLWGTSTLGYHLTNVFLHIVNALLVWRLLGKFNLKFAWVGGLLFAVHPVQVESVAYISELKNTLSLPFFLLAMCSWMDYEDHKHAKDYFWALGLFLAAMLCKITMAPFPVLILFYAWWKRNRIEWSDVKSSVPFFALSIGLGLLTIWAGQRYSETHNSKPEIIPSGDFASQLVNAGLILSYYFERSVFPVGYQFAYPKWPVNPYSFTEYGPGFIFLGGFYWAWRKRQGWGRSALLGLGFFVLFLAPFLGFIPISYLGYTWVMDHFLYIPILGLIGLVVAALGNWEARWPSKHPYVRGAVLIVVAFMVMEGHAFSNLFTSDETLWRYTLQRDPNSWYAHHNLGSDLFAQQRYPEALVQSEQALQINPGYRDGHYYVGIVLEEMGQYKAAQEQYRQAIKLRPDGVKLYIALAESLLKTGQSSEAIDLYRLAVARVPDFAQFRYNLGTALLQTGQISEAVQQLTEALKLDPDLAQAHENLGTALAQSGSIPEAIAQFEAAIQLDPGYVAAHNNLGRALAQVGHIPEAIEQFQQVLQIDPDNATARQNLMKLQAFLKSAPATK